MKKFLFLCGLATALFALGCGGSGTGSGGGDEDVVDIYLSDYAAAYRTENLDALNELISSNYLNDCVTEEDILDEAAALFNDPLVSNIEIEYRNGLSTDVDLETGRATFTTTRRLTYDLNGVEQSDQTDFTNELRQEGLRWRLFGNQECNAAAKN